jgi:hypothetical protein
MGAKRKGSWITEDDFRKLPLFQPVKVGTIWYTVSPMRSRTADGSIQHNKAQIKISHALSYDRTLPTLFHEICHAWTEYTGLGDIQDSQNDALATIILSTIQNNPHLVEKR